MKLLRSSICKFYLLLFLFVVQTNFVFSQSKKYQSLLWEISGNGLAKPSYLYGTMHVSKKLAFHLTEAFFESLKNVDVVALESNPETWLEELMGDSKGMLNSSVYKKYLFQYNQNFYKDAFSFQVPTDKNIQYQISKEPEDVNGLLYRYNGYSGNFEEQTYLDLFIMQAGRKSGKKIASLEDYKTSMEMVTKASLPDENEKDKYVHKSYSVYTIGDQIESAYRSGDLDGLDSLNKLTYPTKKYEKYMLLDRNKIMVHSMDSLMKIQSVFTAIGAAHLPGDEGVITLLRNMGYTVKAINSEVTKNSIKLMTKIGDEHTDVSFKTQYIIDSTLKLDVPGKMYEMNASSQFYQCLYTDMVNGSYYVVKRMKTYGTFTEQDAKSQFDRIDKLLYESVPGKIIEKKTIKANDGSPGFDILNKTDRGDFQRYEIFAKDEFVYIIKVSGTGDYVKSSDFDKFFQSVKFISKPVSSGWTTFEPSYGDYQISVPGNYSYEKPKDVNSQVDNITATEGSNYYIFDRSVLSDYEYIEEDTFDLHQLAKNFYEPLDYKLKSSAFGTYNSYPSIDVVTKHKSNGSFLHIKIILKDAQYFLMACKSNEEHAPEKYFSSLKFTDFKYKPFETYKDTLLHYTAKTDYTEAAHTSSLEKLLTQYTYMGKKDTKIPSYAYKYENKTITSPATGEEIKVEYYRSNDYRMDGSIDKLWKREVNYFSTNTSFNIFKKQISENNKIPVMDLVLTDTNTIRAVRIKLVYKPGLLYVLYTMGDTVSKPSAWVSAFYDSFLPDDTIFSKSTFTDKIPEFMKDLASTDSVTRDKVNTLYNEIDFENKDAESLMKFISGKDFNNASMEVRSSLISSLGALKNSKITPFFQKEYGKYVDSTSLQLAILNALADQKTKEGNLAFVQLLKTETPLSDDESAIQNIFTPFYDSLEIAKTIFPQLLNLTKYPEYKDNVYSLLSSLLDSSLINSQFYTEQKKDILRQANEELKRQMASEENNSTSTTITSDYGSAEKAAAKAEAEAERIAKAIEAGQDYSNYSSDDNSSSINYSLLNYYDLLAPFYSEAPVKTAFDKAFKSKNQNFKIELTGILLKNNLPVADTTINRYAKDIKTRSYIYATLKRIKKLNRIDQQYCTQTALSYAALYGSDDDPKKTDSIEFVCKKYVESTTQKGYVYFYKSKNTEGGQKYIDYVGFQPKDTAKVDSDPVVSSRSTDIDSEKTIDEQINDICYELSLSGRKRIKSKNKYDDLYGDY